MSISVVIRSARSRSEGNRLGGDPTDVPSLTLDGSRIVIGRGAGCEVRLPDPSVSQRHATLRGEGSGYALVDEGSSNGTFVGGVRLTPHAPRTLRNGDVVRVGRVWLEVRINQGPPTLDLPAATRDIALRLVADAMRAMGDEVDPHIEIVEGPDRGRILSLDEEGRVYVAGRGEDCDFIFDDMDGSRRHIQVTRLAGAVRVRDLGSKNGVWLGESSIPRERDVQWRSPTMLRVGQNVLALKEPVAEALAELESAPDEALPETGAPALPAEPAPVAAAPPPPAASSAPLTEAPSAEPPAHRARSGRKAWSAADLAVVVAAVSIVALSVAGLYWLLRG
jgi:pSer/pThr/pTyr-binding forkhead associated (FHA) protein